MVKEFNDCLVDELIKEIVKKYADAVCKNYKIEAIILFGSYAKGTNHEDSDIDIAVVTDDFETNRFDEQLNLRKLSWDIDSRIEPHLIRVGEYKTIGNPLVWEIVNTGIKVA